MRLPLKSPCRKSVAIHSASFMSVLRPGTCLTCWALTRSTWVITPSSRLWTGFQYTPVLSRATCRQPLAWSQVNNSSTCVVVVPNCRCSFATRPEAPVVSKQAVTNFLWTSSPQQMLGTAFMVPLPEPGAAGDAGSIESPTRAPADAGRQMGVPHGVGSDSPAGTGAPARLRPRHPLDRAADTVPP